MQDLLFRIKLRLLGGQKNWHNRRFPPSFKGNLSEESLELSYNGNSINARWLSSLKGSGACNIVLSGPSVKGIRNPRLLNKNYNIWVNGAVCLAQQANIKPSLYLVSDPSYIKNKTADFIRFSNSASKTLINFAGLSELLRRIEGVHDRFYLFDDPRMPFREASEFPVQFPENAIRGGHSVVLSAIRIAFRMGFREIFLYGLDLGGTSRFYQEGQPEPSHMDRDFEIIRREMRQVAMEASALGVKLWNCSTNSRLDSTIIKQIEPNVALALSKVRGNRYSKLLSCFP
jgi:hypothetical protein